MATDNKPLKIIIGESTHPIVENIESKDSSLFSELYDKTFSCIENYLKAVGYGEKKNDDFKKSAKTDYPNNIIAFVGERGSGKTSCMLSVTEMLQNKKESNAFQNYPVLNVTNFVSVNVIEPSFINDKANVLELVVATLFRNFKETVEKDVEHIDLNKKHSLLEAFQKVQENLKYIKKGTAELETIDSLLQLSSSVDLKENMRNLVASYLEFMNGTQRSILLLPIDDIDLNTKYAYDMVEQIRKYLVLPNVLILVSLKLDQLEQVLRNDFTKQFSDSLNKAQDKNPLLADIQQMAERYIQKLIPLGHRMFMPDMEAAMDKPYLVYHNAQQAQENYENDSKLYQNDESKILKHQILASIFEKTRFLFYNTKGKVSYIIPRNLREFRNLVALLDDLPKYEGDNFGNCYNKTIFKKYFYETWCENNLSVEKNNLFSQITSVQDAVDINATVLQVLRDILKQLNVYDELKKANHYKYILSENNYKWNISLGDVMAVLNYYESHTSSMDDLKFVFAVKTHYSMKLYEYYDELTAAKPAQNLYDFSLTKNENEDRITSQIIRKDLMRGHSNYARLVGGSFIHSGIVKLLPDQGSYLIPRSQRMMNYFIIRQIMETIERKLKSLPDNKDDLTNEQESVLGNVKRQIQFVEFFLLLSSHKCDTKNETSSDRYREDRDICYSTDLSGVKKNLVFDITSCFFNCLDIQAVYSRTSNDFLKSLNKYDSLVDDNNKSLLAQIEKCCAEKREKPNVRHSCYSQLSIRNIEVLDDLVTNCSTNIDYGSSEDKIVYRNFFGKLSSYKILTYIYNDKEYYNINFSPLSILKDFLDSLDEGYNSCLKLVLFGSFQYEGIDDIYTMERRSSSYSRKYDGERIIRNLMQLNRDYYDQNKLNECLNEFFDKDKEYGIGALMDNCQLVEKNLDEYDKKFVDELLGYNDSLSDGNVEIMQDATFNYDLKGFYVEAKNNKATIIKKIKDKNKYFPDQTRLNQLLNDSFSEPRYGRDQIEEICVRIAEQLTSQN